MEASIWEMASTLNVWGARSASSCRKIKALFRHTIITSSASRALIRRYAGNLQITPNGDRLGSRRGHSLHAESARSCDGGGSDPAPSPIGGVIVTDSKIIAAERNHLAEDHDAVAHAEIEAIRKAGESFPNGELRGATLYSTLQPCGMCTMASIWSKVGRIVYGAGREDFHQMYFEARHVDTLNFVKNAYRDDLVIEGGLLREDCSKLYYRPWDKVPLDEQGNK